jgi:hypothetical protein
MNEKIEDKKFNITVILLLFGKADIGGWKWQMKRKWIV